MTDSDPDRSTTGNTSEPEMDSALTLLATRVAAIEPRGEVERNYTRCIRAAIAAGSDKETALELLLDSLNPYIFASPAVLADRSLHVLLRDVLLYLECPNVPARSERARILSFLPPLLFQGDDKQIAQSLIDDFDKSRSARLPPSLTRSQVLPEPEPPAVTTEVRYHPIPTPSLARTPALVVANPPPPPPTTTFHTDVSTSDDHRGLLRTLTTRWFESTKYSGALSGVSLENLRNSIMSAMQE